MQISVRHKLHNAAGKHYAQNFASQKNTDHEDELVGGYKSSR